MARIFEKDYKYLLANLIPQHRLSVQRRRHIRTATAGGEPAQMRVAAVLALEELYESQYFDRARTREVDGDVVVTYVRNDGSYQIRLVLPLEDWKNVAKDTGVAEGRGRIEKTDQTLTVDQEPVETTINILPDIIRSFSIDGQRESTLHRLDSVLRFMPVWFRFTTCRLVLVEERVAEREERGEFVVTQRETIFHEKVIYQNCRHSRQTAVLDHSGARAEGIPRPAAQPGTSGAVENARLAVAPIFSQDDFWGVLEVWFVGDDDGSLFRNRVEIASGMVEQIIENAVRLENLTSIDKLTGVYNRQFYDRLVRIEMERATRSGTKLSLLVVDIDDFKAINDTLGHRKGDEALVVVADLIRDNLRKIDSPFRYGGEEFVILLPGTAEMEAIHTAERLRTVIGDYGEFLDDQGKRRRITVSIGAAVFPGDARTEEELFSRADAALFLAKRKGKNRVEFYRV